LNCDLITIRKFTELQKAEFYAIALRNHGIQTVINHSLLSSLLPLGQIELCVNDYQVNEAMEIVSALDAQEHLPLSEDFREADLEDIVYQKELNQKKRKSFNKIFFLVMVIILAILLTQYLRWSYGLL
jgi:hypothetical protein